MPRIGEVWASDYGTRYVVLAVGVEEVVLGLRGSVSAWAFSTWVFRAEGFMRKQVDAV